VFQSRQFIQSYSSPHFRRALSARLFFVFILIFKAGALARFHAEAQRLELNDLRVPTCGWFSTARPFSYNQMF
jgi:hypothetical protein